MKEQIKILITQQGIHGVEHAERVCKIALKIASHFPNENLDINSIIISAMLHDCGRVKDFGDRYHAYASANKALKFLKENNIVCDIGKIGKCIIHHNPQNEENYEIPLEAKIISDADKLDRWRFRSGCDVRYLELEESKLCVEYAKELNRK